MRRWFVASFADGDTHLAEPVPPTEHLVTAQCDGRQFRPLAARRGRRTGRGRLPDGRAARPARPTGRESGPNNRSGRNRLEVTSRAPTWVLSLSAVTASCSVGSRTLSRAGLRLTGSRQHLLTRVSGQIGHCHTSGVVGALRMAYERVSCNDSLTSSCTFGRTAVMHLP